MKVIKGNVFDAILEGYHIMHCCNNKRTMGSGIAKHVKFDYTEAYLTYLDSSMCLGTISVAENIINAIAQDGYGKDKIRYIKYDALVLCCEEINNNPSIKKVAVPYLFGSDRAGGNWNIVSAILENTLNCPVVAYRI